MDTYDKIACRECGQEMSMLVRHLKLKHSMTCDEYVAKHEGAPYISDAVRNKYSDNNASNNPDVAKRRGETFTKKVESGEIIPWRRGQNKDNNEAVARQSESLTGKNKTNTKGIRLRGLKMSGENNPACRPEVKEKIKESLARLKENDNG